MQKTQKDKVVNGLTRKGIQGKDRIEMMQMRRMRTWEKS
jgi:hypothetical protein